MPTFAVRRIRGSAWNPDLAMGSQVLWPEHAAFMNALAADRFVIMGGPVGAGVEFLLVIEAASKSVVIARLAQDPWCAAGLLTTRCIEEWTLLLDSGTDQRGGG